MTAWAEKDPELTQGPFSGYEIWQEWEDSNPRPAVLESDAERLVLYRQIRNQNTVSWPQTRTLCLMYRHIRSGAV